MSQAAGRQHVSVEHPNLGKVTGLTIEEGVQQYRGIKYATVKERFAESVPHEQKDIDATNWGPSSPQPADGFPNEQMFIQQALPSELQPEDELNCLNLNITAPQGASGKALPVLVFVHGGALFVGANSWPHYDQAKLVALASSQGRPIIAVNINYRLGAAGWLASPKAGIKGNLGARDAVIAFEWVRKHIAGFGGDPNNVTALGNSAGSGIITALLYQDKPLFDKVIPAGGTALLGPMATSEKQEEKLNTLAGMLGIDASKEAFEKVSIQDLVQKTPLMFTGLAVDGDLFQESQTSTLVAQKQNHRGWCKEIFIGNNEHDASIMIMGMLGKLDKVGNKLPGYLKQALPEYADDIIKAYNVSENMSQADALEAIASLATDVLAVPAKHYLTGWPNERRYFFRFAVPNPWDGALKGYATHILEIAFLFQNYNRVLSEENVKIAQQFATSIIGFMYGEQPCKPWTESDEGREDLAFGSLRAGDPRKQKTMEIADKVGYEKLSGIMMGFLFGP